MTSRSSFARNSAGTCADGTTASENCMSTVPASICCCTAAASCPMATSMLSTWALRIGSVSAFHTGLRSRTKLWSGSYDAMRYGPVAIMFWRSSGESGRYSRYSTGWGEVKTPSARMLRKSAAGWVRVNSTVCSSVALTPLISLASM